VDKDHYLLTLCRYVVLNPVRAKIVKDLKETGNGVLNQVFVRSGIKAESPLKAIKGQLFLGQENFIEEITRKQRYLTKPALKEIFKGKDKKSKDQVMSEAYLQYGYTLKDIAEYIGVHYTTVSRAIKKIEGEDEK
jgi:hypothetical protein